MSKQTLRWMITKTKEKQRLNELKLPNKLKRKERTKDNLTIIKRGNKGDDQTFGM